MARLAVGCILVVALPAAAQAKPSTRSSVNRAVSAGMSLARHTSGAYVVDLTTGRTLASWGAYAPRMPASVEKLYTTSTALARFGPSHRLATSILGAGSVDSAGGWHGTLYLKGGGDPTFGSQSFDHAAYGAGATIQSLVAGLRTTTGITSVQGRIVGDGSLFDSLRGTAPYGYARSSEIEGQLSALAYDRGFANAQWTAFQPRPALYAAQQLAAALKAAGIQLKPGTEVSAGVTPRDATALASVDSPTIGWLAHLTNTPSDNFIAEMLLKDLGAYFSHAGTTAAGAAIVRSQMAASFGIHPALEDGSGLSRRDLTSPVQVVTLLRAEAGDPFFTGSLAVAGISGTMEPGLRGTYAQGRCRGKTGTLHDVANLAGYCTARNGHTLAFAFLMNGVDPYTGHAAEDRMTVALARYDG